MTKETQNKITYMVYCVNGIADKFGLNIDESFSYIDKYQGLAFLDECYDAEHQLSLNQAINDIATICKRNGGYLQ